MVLRMFASADMPLLRSKCQLLRLYWVENMGEAITRHSS